MSDQRVDLLHRGRRFEVHVSGGRFYAQSHCAGCRTTMSSGEWFDDVKTALVEAAGGMDAHEARCKQVGKPPIVVAEERIKNAQSLMEAQLAFSVFLAQTKAESVGQSQAQLTS